MHKMLIVHKDILLKPEKIARRKIGLKIKGEQ